MIDLPDFRPLKISQSARDLTRAALDSFDHLLVAVPADGGPRALRALPYGRELEVMLARARKLDTKRSSSHLRNRRATGITLALFDARSPFATLTWSREVISDCLRDKPAKLGIATAGLDEPAARGILLGLVAAAQAAAFDLPTFKTQRKPPRASLKSVRLLGVASRIDLAIAQAEAFGNNVARWFTALPPNELTPASYRRAIAELVEPYSIASSFLDEKKLAKLTAGAFLAVAQGSATRDAGILHLRYRPKNGSTAHVAFVGKGILFDTGGTNLKPFKGMLDMHTDMQGSAVALGSLLALAELEVAFGVDAWLAITENRLSATAYKSQDIVHAVNGTSIQIIHTDAEGRMVLADTLALAAREKPTLMIDYATLTGSCVAALTDRYSGAFSNRRAANALVTDAGIASGERVWPFPMDDDFDELLKSDVADVKQCAIENDGDHILGARFLQRFVPNAIPWIHLDLGAGQHKGGLAHVPTDITGFGVRLTIELLCHQVASPEELAEKLSA